MKNKGFSLLELLVVLGVILLLALITIPTFFGTRVRNQFWEEREHLFGLLADARANAFASKACYISDSENRQADTWALFVDENASEITIQLMCKPADLDSLACTGKNGDYCPQPVTGHDSTNEHKRTISADNIVTDIVLIGVNDRSDSNQNVIESDMWVQYRDEGRELVIYSDPTFYREGFIRMTNSDLSLDDDICFEIIKGYPVRDETCTLPATP